MEDRKPKLKLSIRGDFVGLTTTQYIKEVNEKLTDHKQVLENLIGKSFVEQGNRFVNICPWHKSSKGYNFSYWEYSKRGVSRRWKCFSCGKSGDVIEFLMQDKGFSKREACDYLNCQYNLLINANDENSAKSVQKPAFRKKIKRVKFQEKDRLLNITSSIMRMAIHNKGYDYWCNERGLSKKIVDKYMLLDTDLKDVVDNKHVEGMAIGYYPMVLPIWYKGDVIGVTARRKINSDKYPNWMNLRDVDIHPANLDLLFGANNLKTVFVCEAYLDSLSIESASDFKNRSIGLNSVSNAKYLVEYIKAYKARIKIEKFVLCGDNDRAGKEMNEYLAYELSKLGFKIWYFQIPDGFKDMNDILRIGNLKEALNDFSNYLRVA